MHQVVTKLIKVIVERQFDRMPIILKDDSPGVALGSLLVPWAEIRGTRKHKMISAAHSVTEVTITKHTNILNDGNILYKQEVVWVWGPRRAHLRVVEIKYYKSEVADRRNTRTTKSQQILRVNVPLGYVEPDQYSP